MTKEELDIQMKYVEKLNAESLEEAKKYENGISTVDLHPFLIKAKILCGKTVMRCVEIKCVAEDGSCFWNPVNMQGWNK